MILSKNVFVRGVFFGKITADAVGATLCRPARRNGVMKNSCAVGSQNLNYEITMLGCLPGIFYAHTENTELTETHRLRVLAMRDVQVRPSRGGGPT